jgi:cytidyltransferase-like protein
VAAHGTCFVLSFSTQTTAAATPVSTDTATASATRHQQRHYESVLYATTPSSTTTSSSSSTTKSNSKQPPPPKKQQKQQFKHALAILAMPYTSIDKIINERILETVLASSSKAEKLSVVLRCQNDNYAPPSVASLRKYVGEIYSQLWDTYMSNSAYSEMVDPYHLPDVVVYPQNLPNTAPESWIDIQPDLDCVCTFNALCGWTSEEASGRGQVFQNQNADGRGGLDEHVAALNAERKSRNLPPVQALHVQEDDEDDTCHIFQRPADEASYVTFLDDDDDEQQQQPEGEQRLEQQNYNRNNGYDNDLLLSGPVGVGDPGKNKNNKLYDCVAVGGTFDGLHFGHRKLLTLAISSLHPLTGKLTIGITKDEMLKKKKYAEYIPTLQQRMNGVQSFLHRLAPGILKYVLSSFYFLLLLRIHVFWCVCV